LLQNIEDNTLKLHGAIIAHGRLLQDDRNSRTRINILDWISKLDHNLKHNFVRLPRVEGSGGWLLERKEYVSWKDGDAGSNILWCHGIQGSGKSVLTSIIIDELRGLVSQPETYIAFFYFDYRVQGDQTAAHVLSSLLRQIVSTMPELPQSIIDVYEKAHDSTPLLPLHELEKLILNIALTIPRLYIIIDALDECD
ncbi:hypothetical protein DH86_00003148, partial [Scytalidium sp. 3C]